MVIVRIWEGLGNQLFQYAYARALKERGVDVRLDLGKAYDGSFRKCRDDDPRQNSVQNFNITVPEINVEEYGKYRYIRRDNVKERIIFSLAGAGLWKYRFYEEIRPDYSEKADGMKGDCYVKGWFQSEKYFNGIRGILLKELTPKRKIRIPKGLRQALEYEGSVSLHVRRGDFVKKTAALNAFYYRAAAERMKEQYGEPLFLVFSDDLGWVKKNLDIGGNCIYVNEDRALQDYEEMLIMSRCRSNIVSNSTFSWWGAWLNRNAGKTVIAPGKHWMCGGIVPEGWYTL